MRRPERVLCIGLALAVLGWGLDTQTKVQTDITKLVPQNLGSLQALRELERTTGVGGGNRPDDPGKDLATPATIEWMSRYEAAVLPRFGYSDRPRLRQGQAVPGLLAARTCSAARQGAARTAAHERRRWKACSGRSRRTSPRT